MAALWKQLRLQDASITKDRLLLPPMELEEGSATALCMCAHPGPELVAVALIVDELGRQQCPDEHQPVDGQRAGPHPGVSLQVANTREQRHAAPCMCGIFKG